MTATNAFLWAIFILLLVALTLTVITARRGPWDTARRGPWEREKPTAGVLWIPEELRHDFTDGMCDRDLAECLLEACDAPVPEVRYYERTLP